MAIKRTPGVLSSVPCVGDTRIPVWMLEQARRLGVCEADILRNYPTLTAQDLAEACDYVSSHREEIERQIEVNEKD